jgi:hypothetical protein
VGGVSTAVLAAVPLHKPLSAFRSGQRVSFGSPLEVLQDFLEICGSAARSLRPTGLERISGAVAQLGERLICIQEVAGSIPTSSTRVDEWSYDPAMGL